MLRCRCAVLSLVLVLVRPFLSGQEAARPQKQPPPVQQQLDELRQGQARLEAQVAELKALLLERGGRIEGPAQPKPQGPLIVNVFGEPFKGSPQARVAVMEYSDFECTYCGIYATQTQPRIEAAYVRTGKVKYFFRDLPGPEHPGALFKARAARCAGDQGKFWEMHDQLFASQKTWSDQDVFRLTRELGLDGARFSDCLNGDRHADAIRRSAASAARLGINGTPAFLVGTLSEDGSVLTARKVFLGAEPFESFQGILEELLSPVRAPVRP
jgi:protein-disulfide isomerase